MTPQTCTTTHNPPHSYGDCLRACIATVLDMEIEYVPHFADKGVTGLETLTHVRKWLGERGWTMATFGMPGDQDVADVLEYMSQANPTVTWLLFGSTSVDQRDLHVNVCQGGKVVHDPAWVPSSIKAPYVEDGVAIWQIWLVTRL